MAPAIPRNPTLTGALCALAAVVLLSFNDMAMKFLSGDYALHQLVLMRSVVGIAVIVGIMVPLAGSLSELSTRRLGLHLLRGACVVFSNLTFFLGLSTLPLAEGVATFFVAPLIITVFSVVFLAERVGPLRWGAVVVGLLGVIVVMRPGTEVFQPAALLPVAAAVGYGFLHILTRHIGATESALSLAFYIQVSFVAVAAVAGLALGDGRHGGTGSAALDFLFRAWVVPDAGDLALIAAIGAASALGGFFISQAYRVAEAAAVAPVEYAAIPMAVFWGLVVFGEWPDAVAFAGMGLIAGSGLFMVWREARVRPGRVREAPRYRR